MGRSGQDPGVGFRKVGLGDQHSGGEIQSNWEKTGRGWEQSMDIACSSMRKLLGSTRHEVGQGGGVRKCEAMKNKQQKNWI